jgi:hypothetical protein
MRGWTEQDLKASGNRPVDRDRLTIFVMVGIRTVHFLRREVGIGSSSQDELLDDEISLAISSQVAGANSVNRGGGEGGEVWGDRLEELDCKLLRMSFILVEKKEANLLERSTAFSNEGRDIVEVRISILLIVVQSDLGLDFEETSVEW